MAIVRMTAAQARAAARVDYDKIAATTEDDIRRHQIEDGEDPDAPLGEWRENFVGPVRFKLELSLEELADLTRIPIESLRDWDQVRSDPDPAAKALLKILLLRPEATKAALEEAFREKSAA